MRIAAMRLQKRLCVVALLSILMAQAAHASPERDTFVRFLDYSAAKSEPTYDAVERGMSTIPKDIRQALTDNGYYILIAPTMLSAKPGWEGATVRGWDPDSNYDNVGGLFEPGTRRLIIPERVQSRSNPNSYLPNTRAELTARHELGHAYDDFQGHVSLSDSFVDAYTTDADRLHNEERDRFAYFLQPGSAGANELFAELFAAAYTPDNSSNPRYRDLLNAFPRTTQVMLKLNPNRPKDTKKPEATTEKSAETRSPATSEPDHPAAKTIDYSKLLTDEQVHLIALHKQLTPLYASGKYAQAEPLMKEYTALLERDCCGNESAATRLKQTYASYADLLRRVNKPAEAQKITAKAEHIRVAATTPKARADAADSNSPVGIVGLKFVLVEGNQPEINSVFPGLPAAQAGLHPGDYITSVDNTPITNGISKEEVYDMIIGPPGTPVRITVRRGQQSLTVTLKRVRVTDIPDPQTRRDYINGM